MKLATYGEVWFERGSRGFDEMKRRARDEDYKGKRANGTDQDNPPYPFPADGQFSEILVPRGQCSPGSYGRSVMIRYTQGPRDLAWMQARDERYVMRLLREGTLDAREPNLEREIPALYTKVQFARQQMAIEATTAQVATVEDETVDATPPEADEEAADLFEEILEIAADQIAGTQIVIPQLTLAERKKVKLPRLTEIENLVFQGGGVKGFAYLGALQILLDPASTSHLELSKIKRVAGASAGAITSFLLAIGYSFDELDGLMSNLDFFDAFLDDGPNIYTHHSVKYVVGKLLELTKQFETDEEDISKLNLVIYLVYHYIRYRLRKALGRAPTEVEIKAKAKKWHQKLISLIKKAGSLLKDLVFGNILGTLWSHFLELLDQALQKLMSGLSGILFAGIEAKLREIWQLNQDNLHELLHAICATLEYVFDSAHKGLFSGQKLVAWFEQRLRDKGLPSTLTFFELACIRRPEIKRLYIMALNLSTGHTEIFSTESTPFVRIVDAVRVSLSIPLFFQPYELNYDGMRDHVYADGGILDNYPINIFDTSQYQAARFFYQSGHYRVFNRRTLGLRLVTDATRSKYETGNMVCANTGGLQTNSSILRYGWALTTAVMDKQESDHLRSNDQPRSVYISSKDIGTVDFNLSQESKATLRTEGQNGALSYLHRLQHDTSYEAQFSRWNFWHSAGLASLSHAGIAFAFLSWGPVLDIEPNLFWYTFFSAASSASADLISKCLAYSKSPAARGIITDQAKPGHNPVKINLQKRIWFTGSMSSLFAVCMMGGAGLFGPEIPSLKFSLLLAATQGIVTTAMTAVDEKYLAAPYVPSLSWQYGGSAM